MIDRYGRCVEVIVLNHGHGPQQWIRVSWRGILLGPGAAYGGIGQGYYRTVVSALRHVDVESRVEVIPLPTHPREDA
jgi:hypothetical protein